MLRCDPEFAGFFHVTIGHAGSIERRSGTPLAVEQNQPPGGVRAMRELTHASVRNGLRERERSSFFTMREQHALIVQQIGRHFGHHNFHDAFAVASAGNAAGLGVGITPATDEW